MPGLIIGDIVIRSFFLLYIEGIGRLAFCIFAFRIIAILRCVDAIIVRTAVCCCIINEIESGFAFVFPTGSIRCSTDLSEARFIDRAFFREDLIFAHAFFSFEEREGEPCIESFIFQKRLIEVEQVLIIAALE